MAILNQFSFVFFSVLGGVMLAFVFWRWRSLPLSRAARMAVFALYVAGAGVVGVALRYPEGKSHAASVERIETTLTDGRPTFVMLYSNY